MRTSIILLLIALTSVAHAATYTVTNTNDAGAGSLRTAITSANAAAGNIVAFNIPTTDPGYNSTTGVFTINIITLLPAIQNINITIDGTTQPNNTNPDGPEICIKGNGTLEYGICVPTYNNTVKGFIINGFQCGVLIYKAVAMINCTNNIVSDCYCGVNYNGTVADPNDIGVALYGNATSNTVKNCILSGNNLAGVGIRSANSNIVEGNIIGSNKDVTYRIPNYYGVAIDSSSYTFVGGNSLAKRNYISGNEYAGVAINTEFSQSNIIKGNYIGVNGTAALYTDTIANYYGIAINESSNNQIGGTAVGEGNLISGNTDGGIAILGTLSTGNVISGNLIGTNAVGNDSIPNINGILISGGSNNIIGNAQPGGKNVISGNKAAGIAMAYFGTNNNHIKGNYIGTDKTGMQPISNHTGIYIFSNANKNIIGGTQPGERNIISANIEMGICMEAADSNIVVGNYIGPDSSGLGTFYNDTVLIQGNGLYFNSTAAYNIAGGYNAHEGNIISGNRVYGLIYYGNAPFNECIGNYIGTDKTGNVALPNTTGICVDGGANHNPIVNNVLSGNLAYGIFIVTTGTYYNELKGNKIGTNEAGTAAVPNQIGLIMGGGTKYNTIGGTNAADRNIISGNIFNGIEVADSSTMYNNIIGNYIGTNMSGTAPIPNYNGIGFATRPSKNNIENNLISGNSYIGLLFYELSDSNTVYSNKIGTDASGTSPLGNEAGGIAIVNSNHNIIGEPGKGNIIAYNDTIGIGITDDVSKFNTFSANRVFANGIMDIDIFPFGVNPNDAGDVDDGGNELMNFPYINNVLYDWGNGTATIEGTIDNASPDGIRIEIFMSDNGNMFGYGGATQYVGFTTSDASGNWTYIGTGVNPTGMITAIATDVSGNSSEFSQNADVTVSNPLIETTDFAVYPNPADDYMIVSCMGSENTFITMVSPDGREVVMPCRMISKNTAFVDLNNKPASGLYFINASSGNVIKVVIK